MNYAVEYYNLPTNPCSRVKSIGKKRADEMRFWTLDQFNHVIKFEDKPGFHAAFMILYWGGLREGETLALTPRKVLDATHSVEIKYTTSAKIEKYTTKTSLWRALKQKTHSMQSVEISCQNRATGKKQSPENRIITQFWGICLLFPLKFIGLAYGDFMYF